MADKVKNNKVVILLLSQISNLIVLYMVLMNIFITSYFNFISFKLLVGLFIMFSIGFLSTSYKMYYHLNSKFKSAILILKLFTLLIFILEFGTSALYTIYLNKIIAQL